MKYGTVYGVGIGPGDPELITVKAARILRESAVIAVPGETVQDSLAYRIAVQAVPEIAGKHLLALPMPMSRDAAVLENAHRHAAEEIKSFLRCGEDVAFPVLGDPSLYSTFSYVQEILQREGYPTAVVPGVPAVCAAAAELGIPLAQGEEPLHILPAVQADMGGFSGTVAVMKCGRCLPAVQQALSGRRLFAAENCGLPGEKLYPDALPETAGYFTVVLAKGK